VRHALPRLWVPETLHQSCDLRVFVDEAAEPVLSNDAGVRVRWHRRQGPKCRLGECSVRAVEVEVLLVVVEDISGRVPPPAPTRRSSTSILHSPSPLFVAGQQSIGRVHALP